MSSAVGDEVGRNWSQMRQKKSMARPDCYPEGGNSNKKCTSVEKLVHQILQPLKTRTISSHKAIFNTM